MEEIKCLLRFNEMRELSQTRYLKNAEDSYPKSYAIAREMRPRASELFDDKKMVIHISTERHTVWWSWEDPDIPDKKEDYDKIFDDVLSCDAYIDNVLYGYNPDSAKDNEFIMKASSDFMPMAALISHMEGVQPKPRPVAIKSIEFSKELLKELKRTKGKC